jgi:hypothetical protein
MGFLKKACFAMVVLALSATLLHAVEKTGSLKGTIVDETGAALPGVTVEISSPVMMGVQVSTTDEKGFYRFLTLPPGIYKLKASFPDMKDIDREGIEIRVGVTSTLDMTMTAGATGEVVTVTGEVPVVDREKTGLGDTLTNTLIQNIPSGRSYQSMARLAPGVLGSGNPNVHGGTFRSNAYLIDGINVTDPVTGTFSFNFNFDAIQDIEVKTGAFEAEYGQSGGGIINVVTKSGGNTFSGEGNFYFQDDSFSPKAHGATTKNELRVYDPSASLGGPILKDKAWFFGNVEYQRSELRNFQEADYGWPKRVYAGKYFNGKLSFQMTQNNHLALQFTGDPTPISNTQVSAFFPPETEGHQNQGSYRASGTWTNIINQNQYIEVHGNFSRQKLDAFSQSGDDTTPSHYDVATGMRSGNYTGSFQYSTRDRATFNGAYNLYIENKGGNHELKFGGEYSHQKFDYRTFFPSNLRYYDRGGNPYYEILYTGEAVTNNPLNQLSLYAQDSWRLSHGVTLNPGVRFDYERTKNDIGETVSDFKNISPRFGLAWDTRNNGKTVLKLNYGRFVETATLGPAGFLNSHALEYDIYFYNPGTGLYDIFFTHGGGAGGVQVDPNLNATHVDELSFRAEHLVVPNLAVKAGFVYRQTRDLLEDTELNWIYDANGDAIGSHDGQWTTIWYLTNPGRAKRYYRAFELGMEKNLSNNWQLLANYTLAKSEGATEDWATDFLDEPRTTINRWGELGLSTRHVVRANGTYFFPHDLQLGFSFNATTGDPRTLFLYNDPATGGPDSGAYNLYAFPRGSQREITFNNPSFPGIVLPGFGPTTWALDLRVEKNFRLGQGKLGVLVDFFNVTNNQRETTWIYEARTGPTGFGYLTGRQSPMSAQLGVRYRF